ncbi:unnamed protein product [Ilex paraguariensis]|uniref:Uncharacterized protein n=1 Tax=Ilex paraguariensis TaxID=185542 RepID=A0ABC8SLM1_9AQUA
MVRTPSSDKNGLKRGSWSDEEDNKLRAYIQKYGHWNWRQLPKFAGLSRCGKSCRLRWMNYLRPGVKRGNYSKEEEHMIMKLHEELETSSMSTNLRSTNWDAEDGMAISSLESFAGPLGNFWSEPFLENTFYYQNYYSSPSTEGGLMSPNLLYDDDAINLFHH